MEFQLLGPIEVRKDGNRLALGGPRQQALLAYLLLHREPVSAERLVRELWHAGEAPTNGSATVHTAVSRLRHTLGGRIERTHGGYTVAVKHDELDLDRFRSLLAAAGGADDAAERSELLRRADALWRGRPLDGLDVPFAGAEARALEELRLGAIEDRIEVDLERGEHVTLLPELVTLVAADPLRERLQAQLILALYRAGRQADALEAYRVCRRTLDEELGLEPSTALKELEGAILRHDPSLDRVAPRRVAASEEGARSRRISRAFGSVLVAAGVAAAVAFAAVHALRAPTVTTDADPTVPTQPGPTQRVAVRPKHRRRTKPRLVSHHVGTPTAVVTTRVVTTLASPTTTGRVTTTVVRGPTTRRPVRPKPKPASKPTPKPTPTPRAVTIADTFGGSAIDPSLWSQSRSGTGWDMVEENGHLEFSFPPTSLPGGVYNNFGGNIETLCKFPGDFDARVDYNLVGWPPGSGAIITLFSFLGPQNIFFQSSRASHAGANGEQYVSYTGWWSSFPGPDTSGTLRVARKNGVITTYYRRGDTWETMSAARDAEQATIAVGALANSTAGFGAQPVTVDFSNFSVTGTSPVC